MPVVPSNLLQGPGTLYLGLFGATEPLDTALNTAPATGWTDAGGTQDGLTLEIDQTWAQLDVDQVVDIPEARLTKRFMTLQTNLAEATLENLARSINLDPATAVVTGTGVKSLEPASDVTSTQPKYLAGIFDGFAPGGFRRRIIARKMLNMEKSGLAYKKDGQTLIPVTFTCFYVSASIKPWRMIDGTA